ncbi:MAG: hypothetical protein R3B47_21530 [Bacteroidia bacterium]
MPISLQEIDTVRDAVHSGINDNPDPDLIMLDIHLADGPSFDIFEEVEVNSPALFLPRLMTNMLCRASS